MKSKTRKAAGKASLDPLVGCCKMCAHFTETRLWDGRPAGTCHRHAPRPWVGHLEHVKADRGSMGILVVQPIWPQVFTTDRCGEHTPNNAVRVK